MRRILLLGCLTIVLAARMGAATEQTVEEMVPPGEQDVQGIGPAEEQVAVDATAGNEQAVEGQVPPSDAARIATKVGHVAIGVTAAAVSLGATAAMLLFL